MSQLCDLSAVELRRRISAKEISPVELLESCRRRVSQVNPALNAVVAADWDAARKAARAAEDKVMRGEDDQPLLGLPVGIKDLNETKGLRTTYGSELYADHVPDFDDSVTAAVRAAGGVIAAKTNTPEFGAGANTRNAVYGFTGNPFDPARTCGGSSGGSAVALATGMLPLASGSDLGGSLRTPAAFCGVAGFRGSAGLVPSPGRRLAWSPLSVQGPMARNVADLCLLLSVLAGRDAGDPLSGGLPLGGLRRPPEADLRSLRVAVSEDLGFAPVDDSVRTLFRERCASFAALFGAMEAADPELGPADRIFEVLRAVGFLAAYKDLVARHPDKVGPNVTANVAFGLTLSAADVAWAADQHTQLYRRFLGFMARYDLLICPAAAVPPFSREEWYPRAIGGVPLKSYVSWLGITFGLTLTAHPVAVLPCGLDATGAPFGIQLTGRRGGDAGLLGVALALERALAEIPECRRPLPDIAVLESDRIA